MILTVSADEVRFSIKGALKIFLRDPKALSYFNMTPTGFWNSFQAIFIILIPFMIDMLAQRHLAVTSNDLTLETFPSAHFFGAKFLGLGVEWVLMPIILWFAAEPLGIKQRYIPFIIARNWASVIMTWIFFVPTLAFLGGLISIEVMQLTIFMLLTVVLVFGYRIARATLDKEPLFCLAIVFGDFLLSLTVGQVLWAAFAPELKL